MKTIYTIKGTNNETWEISTYVWQTNNLARRLHEHISSWLIENLCNDWIGGGLFGRIAMWLIEVMSYTSETPNECERREINKQEGRSLNKNLKDK